MTLTFAPSQGPSFTVPEDLEYPHLRQDPIKPYGVVIPLALRPQRRIALHWNAVDEDTLHYIESFFHELLGPASSFFWTPPDRIWAPLHRGPDCDQLTLGGAPGSPRDYTVRFAWYDPVTGGETKGSPVTAFTVQAGKVLTVTAPVFPNGVPAFRVYAGTTPSEEWLQPTHSTVRTWQEPVSGLQTQTQLAPALNTLRPLLKYRMIGGIQKEKITARRWSLALELMEEYT